jgi:hypothetical protein
VVVLVLAMAAASCTASPQVSRGLGAEVSGGTAARGAPCAWQPDRCICVLCTYSTARPGLIRAAAVVALGSWQAPVAAAVSDQLEMEIRTFEAMSRVLVPAPLLVLASRRAATALVAGFTVVLTDGGAAVPTSGRSEERVAALYCGDAVPTRRPAAGGV